MIGTMTFLRNRFDLVGKIGYAVFAGVLGTVLFVLLLSTVVRLDEFTRLIPLILVAFNTAVTGYALIEKTRDRLKHKLLSSIMAGVANVILTHTILNLMFFFQIDMFIFGVVDLIFFLITGLICSGLGGLLALKYFKIC